jgi:hypothetical protein
LRKAFRKQSLEINSNSVFEKGGQGVLAEPAGGACNPRRFARSALAMPGGSAGGFALPEPTFEKPSNRMRGRG